MNRADVQDIIDSNLSIIEITHGMNGYPSQLGDYGIIGFDTYDQAKEFADKNGLETHLFKTRDGWHFWENSGNMHTSLIADDYLRDLGDNYHEAYDDKDYIVETLKDLSNNFDDDFSAIKEFIADQELIQSKLDSCDDTEMVITCDNKYFETIPRLLMQYHEDVHTYAVGVLIPYDYELSM